VNDRGIEPGAVLIEPAAARWGELVRERWGVGRAGQSWEMTRATRAALGLADDRPVVMSGHQPGFWHAGIAAKWFALAAACARTGAQAAWIVVDHDAVAMERIRVPVRHGEESIAARWWDGRTGELAASAGPAERSAACDRAAVAARASGALGPLASESVRVGIQRITKALEGRAGEPNAARQFALAAADALEEFGPRPAVVFATDLARTPAWSALLGAMRRDPARCRETYNAAVRAFPGARVAPLGEGELPLWRLGGPERVRAFAGDLDERARLAPRALLMTAILRLFVCDLFIHGTGGGASAGSRPGASADEDAGYDRITERWIPAWLGDGDGDEAGAMARMPLAPSVVASGTLTLDLPGAAIDPGLAKARWAAHSARHDPALLGDDGAAVKKAEMVQALRSRRTTPGERRAAYAALHALLEESRTRHAARLGELDAAAARAGDAGEQLAIRNDRTWAFPLHEPAKLASLRDAVADEFGTIGR